MLQYLKHNNTRCQRGGAEIDLTDMGAYLAAIGGGGGGSFSMVNLPANVAMAKWARTPSFPGTKSGPPCAVLLSR